MKFEPIQTKDDREFLDRTRLSTGDICKMFGVPEYLFIGPTNYSSVPRCSLTVTSESSQWPSVFNRSEIKLLTHER